MNVPEFPLLRRGIRASAAEQPDQVILFDEFRIGGNLLVREPLLKILDLCDGQHSLEQIQTEANQFFGRPLFSLEKVREIVQAFDQAYFLNSPRLQEHLAVPDRPPSCIGCYDADPVKARKQLAKLFTGKGGPGMPGEPGCRIEKDGRLRAVLVPHMDYARGGVTYGWGFKELIERTDASLFVVIATSHYSPNRFSLTRQNFTSPLGKVETDQRCIDLLVEEYGEGLFADPLAHVPEHSIELEVVLLQYLLEGKRSFRIVPLLVGNFHDCVQSGQEPAEKDDIQRMIVALKKMEAAIQEPICYIISGDLAHIGPKFDDPEPVDEAQLKYSQQRDQAILDKAQLADAAAYFHVIAQEQDSRRICGLPPTYTTLQVAQPRSGKVLHYGRFVDSHGLESVSFASVAFDS